MPVKKRQPSIYGFKSSKTAPILLILIVIIVKFIIPAFSLSEPSHSKHKQPQQWTMYLAIALTKSQGQTFTRAFNKTLANLTENFLDANSDYDVTLNPLVISLPENNRFSAAILENACSTFERKHVVAVLIVGGSPAAFAVALAAGTSGIPVLWARGGNGDTSGYFHQETSPLEVRFEPGGQEMLGAVRSLLLAAHWHSFTVLADSSAATGVAMHRHVSAILDSPPLSPTLIVLQAHSPPNTIFRRLADISRSTRGVVLLLCEIKVAKRIMAEARRLNMMGGHFVWLWVDTSASVGFEENRNETYSGRESSSSSTTTNSSANQGKGEAKTNVTKSPVSSLKNRAKNGRRSRETRDEVARKDEGGAGWRNVSREGGERENGSSTFTSEAEYSNSNLAANGSDDDAGQPSKTDVQGQLVNARRPVGNRQRTGSTSGTVGDSSKSDKKLITGNSGNDVDEGMQNDRAQANTRNYLASVTQDRFALNRNGLRLNRLNPSGNVAQDKANEPLDLRDTRRPTNVRPEWPFSGHHKAMHGHLDDNATDSLPVGLLAIKLQPLRLDRSFVKGSVRLLVDTLKTVLTQCAEWIVPPGGGVRDFGYNASCWHGPTVTLKNFSAMFTRELRASVGDVLAGRTRGPEPKERLDKNMMASFSILNLVPEAHNSFVDDYNTKEDEDGELRWRVVGSITGHSVRLDSIVWPGGDLVVAGLSGSARSVFRVVTALAPPFVMEGELDEDGQCLRGLPCHRVLTSDKDNLTLVFNEMETQERLEDEDGMAETQPPRLQTQREDYVSFDLPNPTRYKYRTNCCYGIAMDLLENVAQELEFDVHLYIVYDGLFGTKYPDKTKASQASASASGKTKWNGIVGDLASGAAHMSFAALSVSSARSEVIDFSAPYFFSGVSFLAAPTQKSEVPLLAFLLPFSPELWIAIFTSLNITAMAVAIYEWLSPFGLNPWGRQRSKNFSIASALWVMWGLLCGHLVAFKAPKSWPNKFLINVWGGFSVIFVASYTANIAALIAGLFFHNNVNYHDRSLLSQRVGAPRASAADDYIHRANQLLWEQMQRYSMRDVADGIQHLKNGSLDILIADTPILDYYRATDHGCKLQKIGEAINEDTYAVGMTKGFPLKDSISAVIAKYSSNGYMDILQQKWYGGLPCFKVDIMDMDVSQPRPLGLSAVAGVFLLLGLGMVVGILILIFEHLFYRYSLPILRHQPKGTIWRSRQIMFFSQKLYRFINCVELVSPHHAARELVHTLRQGNVTSLFQKSVKRKEHEQRRRRKSKAQFFEMIQEIRRVQQEEKDNVNPEDPPQDSNPERHNPIAILKTHLLSPLRSKSPPGKTSPKLFKSPNTEPKKFRDYLTLGGSRRSSRSPLPMKKRRFSTDLVFSPRKVRQDCPSSAIGRRLSKDSSGCWSNSPPDINSRRSSNLDLNPRLQKRDSMNSATSSNPNILSPKVILDTTPRLKVQVYPTGSLSSSNIALTTKIVEEPNADEAASKASKDKRGFQATRKGPPITLQKPVASTMPPKFRGRVRSDNNCKGKVKGRARLRTPSPEGRFGANVRSRSLGDQFLYDEITPFVDPKTKGKKDKRKSVVEVNVTCCESDESASSGRVKKLAKDFETKMVLGASPSGTLKKGQPKQRRQSHQQRLETDSLTSTMRRPSREVSPNPDGKEFLVPVQRHDAVSPGRRRHSSNPIRDCDANSSSDLSSPYPRRQRYPDSPQDSDNVFDDIPPPPPPPACNMKNGNGGVTPLERLNKEELVALWRSSETELRSHLLRAIKAKGEQAAEPP